jgi:hypothetical protein
MQIKFCKKHNVFLIIIIFSLIIFRYYLEPASPLKSINPPVPVANGTSSLSSSTSSSSSSTSTLSKSSQQQQQSSTDNLAVLKSIQLTPPSANNRSQHRIHHNNNNHHHQNGFENQNGNSNIKFLNGSNNNGSIKSDNSSDFVADFGKASIYNSNNSLNSTGSSGGGHVNGKITNGFNDTAMTNGDLNANFADFENNKIYNAGKYFFALIMRIR